MIGTSVMRELSHLVKVFTISSFKPKYFLLPITDMFLHPKITLFSISKAREFAYEF